MKKRKGKKEHGKKITTQLERRKRQGKLLKSPFSRLPEDKFVWSSWKDEHLPNILWACVLAGSLDRNEYLRLFREIAIRARTHWKDNKDSSLCHNFFSTVSQDIFDDIFSPLTEMPLSLKVASSLRFIGSLPDHTLWSSFAPEIEDKEEGWNILARGIVECMDHQSQQATDVRWLKVMFMAICGRLIFPQEMEERMEEFRLYPNKGDMRVVRPSIRALEMTLRNMETGTEKPDHVPLSPSEDVWKELLNKTPCFIPNRLKLKREDRKSLLDEIDPLSDKLCDHFFQYMNNTHVDPRLDSSFGLIFYSIALTDELARLPTSILASGRILLRTIVESYITLHYLVYKDDPTIWAQYRNYGYGQTALAFLKNIDFDETPDFIDLDVLERLSNEDVWFETKDINLGAWANKNLRSMSEECRIKDVYDKYYDWTSGFVHSHWGAVRETVFTTCLNPLHRLHRIPTVSQPMPSVLVDCCKICNRMLDDLNALYPTFSERIKWHNKASEPAT